MQKNICLLSQQNNEMFCYQVQFCCTKNNSSNVILSLRLLINAGVSGTMEEVILENFIGLSTITRDITVQVETHNTTLCTPSQNNYKGIQNTQGFQLISTVITTHKN